MLLTIAAGYGYGSPGEFTACNPLTVTDSVEKLATLLGAGRGIVMPSRDSAG